LEKVRVVHGHQSAREGDLAVVRMKAALVPTVVVEVRVVGAGTWQILGEVHTVPECAVGPPQADVAARAHEEHAAESENVAAQGEGHELALKLKGGQEILVLDDWSASPRSSLVELVWDLVA